MPAPDPTAPLKDNGKPNYDRVDPKVEKRYRDSYMKAKDSTMHQLRAEHHQYAGTEASSIGEDFRQRGRYKDAIAWHLQDAWHHEQCFHTAGRADKPHKWRQAGVEGEVDAWGEVARCCGEQADGCGDAGERAEWHRSKCGFCLRALQAAERPGAEAAGLVKRQQARRLSSPAC